VVSDGETRRFGSFDLTFLESRHSPGDRVPGTIEKPFSTPASYLEWKTGTTWSVLVRHGTRTLLLHGSANYQFGALRGRRADVVYLGIGELGKQSEAFIDSYWDETVVRTGARRVILVHWDNFFRGLDEPLEPMPRVLDHVDDAIKQIRTRAAVDKVDVVLPALWERSDPFAGLS
jgi:L-ascorbate metabolism protein UlaG (beta-lactamase superfamily)